MRPLSPRLLPVFLLAAGSLACSPAGAERDPRTAAELPLSGPGAAAYGEESAPNRWSLAVSREVRALMERPPVPDACLDRAAELLGGQLGPDCAMWPSWIEAEAAQHAGCADEPTDCQVVCVRGLRRADITAELARRLPEKVQATHFGTARVQRGLLETAWVLLTAERGVRLDPFPRRTGPRILNRLSFELSPGLEKPRVYAMRPDGAVDTLDILAGTGAGRFVSYFAPAKAGRHWLEILAEGSEGPRVVALFPVFVGTAPPASVRRPAAAGPEPARVEEAEAMLMGWLNEERAQRGIPNLEPEPALAAAARSWSREMLARGRVAHVSPDGRGPEHRAREAGYSARMLGEVLASGSTLREAHQALMASPAHKAGMLDPRFTQAGIGVAIREEPGRRGYYVSEELGVPTRILSPLEAAGIVAERAARHRELMSLPAPLRSPELDAAASSFADDLAPEPPGGESAALEKGLGRALKAAGWRGPAAASLQFVLDPEEVVLPAEFESPDGVSYGIGAAYRPDPTMGGSTLILLITSVDR